MGRRITGTDCLVEITRVHLGVFSDEARARAEDSVMQWGFCDLTGLSDGAFGGQRLQ
jgi:hypothetical protein